MVACLDVRHLAGLITVQCVLNVVMWNIGNTATYALATSVGARRPTSLTAVLSTATHTSEPGNVLLLTAANAVNAWKPSDRLEQESRNPSDRPGGGSTDIWDDRVTLHLLTYMNIPRDLRQLSCNG